MVFICAGGLAAGLFYIFLLHGYHKEELRKRYPAAGILKIFYPPAYFLYERFFRGCARKQMKAYQSLYAADTAKQAVEERYLKDISLSFLILLGTFGLVICLLAAEAGQSVLVDRLYIQRNTLGEGSLEVVLIASVDGEKEEITLSIGERQLTAEEFEELKVICEEYILEHVKGDNVSLEEVTTDLNFFSEIPGYSVTVSFRCSDYSLIGTQGTVKNTELSQETAVEVTAICTYFEESWEYVFAVVVCPQETAAAASWQEALLQAVAEAEESTAQEEYLVLPDTLGTQEVTWSQKTASGIGLLLLTGCLLILLVFSREREYLSAEKKKRTKQLAGDYPVFVHKLVLLLGAGLTPRAAWHRVTMDYQRSLGTGGERHYVYEEMMIAENKMQQGVTEVAAYESFGRRCADSQYLKFSALLIQSVRTGARGMGQLLSQAGDEAVLLRREYARRKGEEAGTKLLLPMVALLGIVMFIVMIPAFMVL